MSDEIRDQQRLAAIKACVAIGDPLGNQTARFLLDQLNQANMNRRIRPVSPGDVFTYLRTHGGCVDEHDPDSMIGFALWLNQTFGTSGAPRSDEDPLPGAQPR